MKSTVRNFAYFKFLLSLSESSTANPSQKNDNTGRFMVKTSNVYVGGDL